MVEVLLGSGGFNWIILSTVYSRISLFKETEYEKKSKKYKKIIPLFIKRPFLNCKKLRHYYNIELLQKKLPINNLGLQSPACEVSAWEAQAHV